MAVRLRLMRIGKTNRPAYRVCAVDARKPRGGAYLEKIGTYDPFVEDDKKKVTIDKERAEYWLGVGAQPSETVLSFLRQAEVSGLLRPKKRRRSRPKREGHTALKGKAGKKAKKKAEAARAARKPRKPKKKAKAASE